MKQVLLATAALMLSAGIAAGDCDETGYLMIYDLADVQEVVRGGHNMLIAQPGGLFKDGWTMEPSEQSCTDGKFDNFVLRHENGTQVEKLGGVQQIAELVAMMSK